MRALSILLLFGANLFAAPQRVLPPVVTVEDSPIKKAVGLYLRHRLGQCRGVTVIEGQRAERISRWLSSGAFILTPQQRWDRMRSFVDVDAILHVTIKGFGRGKAGVVTVHVERIGKSKSVTLEFPNMEQDTTRLPGLVASLAVSVGKELGLSGKDLEVLKEIRIANGAAFRTVYEIHVSPVIASHRQLGATALLLSPEKKTDHQAELDVAGLKLSVGTITAKMRSRSPSLIEKAFLIGRNATFNLMGTPLEPLTYTFINLPPDEYTKRPRRQMEKLLIEIARPLTYGDRLGGDEGETPAEFAELEEEEGDTDVPTVAELKTPNVVSTQLGDDNFSKAQQTGALRLLGLMHSDDGLSIIDKVAQRDAPALRTAAAYALRGFKDEQGLKTLNALHADTDLSVRLIAADSLWKRSRAPKNLLALARQAIKKSALVPMAADILFEMGALEDVPHIKGLVDHAEPSIRRGALLALLRLAPETVNDISNHFRSGDVDTVVQMIHGVNEAYVSQHRPTFTKLANDPNDAIAWGARDRLAGLRPDNDVDRMRFDLQTAHFFVRHRIIRQIAESKIEGSDDLLYEACSNAEPHTRIAALKALSSRNPERARPNLCQALTDVHKLVRLESAALLADLATANEANSIRSALEIQTDKATRLYLLDALARSESKDAPGKEPSARTIPLDRNLSWLCGAGAAGTSPGSLTSPYDAYYMMDTKVKPGWRKTYENTKKIYIGRATPIDDPGPIQVDAVAQDSFWLNLDAELNADNIPWLDGVLYGEETMKMTPNVIWKDGWRLFCDDAGIDRSAIRGDIEKLNTYQQRAWTTWAMRRIVEGFNRLYDYTKLKYGKLRPGFQVATFLGEQGLWAGPNVADFDWKFDIGGVYHYFGDSRKTAYALVRRYKTIWPNRPVIWLSHGIGVYERTPIKHNHKAPTGPITARWWRCYRDSMTAWLAGADTGWFSIWGFMEHDYRGGGIGGFKGPTITPEDFHPDEAVGESLLDRCITHSFNGVENLQRNAAEIKKQDPNAVDLDTDDNDEGFDVGDIELEKTEDVIGGGIKEAKQRLRTGFFFYRKYLFDLARMFQSLPRHHPRPEALVIHPIQNVWYGTLDSPGADLPVEFDFLIDINKVNHLDLSRYRLITVQNPSALEDRTIRALTKWLEETQGLLYVHVNLTADNAAQSGTVEDYSGNLKLDWPWENQVSVTPLNIAAKPAESLKLTSNGESLELNKTQLASVFRATGGCKVLAQVGEKSAVVFWKNPNFKGGVLFDGVHGRSGTYRAWLKKQFDKIHTDHGIGPKLRGPVRQMLYEGDDFTAASATGIGQPFEYGGPDLINGWSKHVLGRAGGAAFIPHDMHTPYVVAGNGVAVLAESPIQEFQKIEGGISIKCDGLLHAVSKTARLNIQCDGKPLTTVAPKDSNDWILRGKKDGVFHMKTDREETPGSIYFIRAGTTVTITCAPYKP